MTILKLANKETAAMSWWMSMVLELCWPVSRDH